MNNSDVITHHGIRGQKWGIRRYQNADGSLTPAGRKRAQQLKGEYKQLTGKKVKGKIPKESPEGKKVRELNDTELQNRIKRLSNEKQALSLERDLSSNGQKFVRSIGKDIMAPAAISAGKSLMEKVFLNAGAKALGLDKKEVKSSYDELKKSTEVAEMKKRKYEAEKWMSDEMAKQKTKTAKAEKAEASKASTKKESKSKEDNTVNNFNFFMNNAEKKQYSSDGKKIIEATYKDVSSVDQLLLDNKNKGKK